MTQRPVVPHDEEAERSVLSTLLLGLGSLNGLSPADFYSPLHQHIAAAVNSIESDQAVVDLVGVADRLRVDGLLDEVGGIDALHGLQNLTPSVSAFPQHVEIIGRHARHRRMVLHSEELGRAAMVGDEVSVARALERISEVGSEADGSRRLQFHSLPDPLVVPDLDWHAHGLLCRPTHGELAGAEKTLKSYLGLAIDVGLAAGLDVLGRWRVDEPQRVLVMVGEGGMPAFLRRLTRICGAYGIAPADIRDRFRYTAEVAPANSDRFLAGVGAELDSFQPHLVHPDPWYAYAPSNVDARNLYEQGAALERVGALCAEGGASLLFNNHFNQTGNGNGLQRISMAGHAEWCDSWILLSHRVPADVAGGRFRLKMSIGSRQWGGSEHHIDFNLGAWSDDLNDHVGALRWNVTAAVDEGEERPGDERRHAAKAEIVGAWKRSRRKVPEPWTQTEWLDRCTGTKQVLRAAFHELLDDGRVVNVQGQLLDSAGRAQPSSRFVLVESDLEKG